jgi:photosystem II stability/assembly factor-like uncharacterized protein
MSAGLTRISAMTAALFTVGLVLAGATAARAALTWTPTQVGSSQLRAVTCKDVNRCWAVGQTGTILATTDGGGHWQSQLSLTPSTLNGVSCQSTTRCWAVGDNGTIVTTTDGGASWSAQFTGTTARLAAVFCTSVDPKCVAVGTGGTILVTTSGGWSRVAQSATSDDLNGVACPSHACGAVGANGTLVVDNPDAQQPWHWSDSGTTSTLNGLTCVSNTDCTAVGVGGAITAASPWAAKNSPTSQTLQSVSCASTTQCWAVGAGGTVVATTDAWATATSQTVGTVGLYGISCPSSSRCLAVGDTGTILAGTDAGPPVNLTAPAISGSAVDGATLTADNGNWTGAGPIAYAYQWKRCDSAGGNCTAISGATAQTYAVAPGDVGSTLRVAVTATNALGSATATSAQTGAVAAARPSNSKVPSITGGTTQGHTLTASNGNWSGTAPISYSYQWRDCDSQGDNCTTIPGATAQTYTLTAGDVGARIRAVVIATNGGGSASATSQATEEVMAPLPASGVIATTDSPLYSDGFTWSTQNVGAHTGPRLVTDGTTQYVAYYQNNGTAHPRIRLGKRTLPNGSWVFADTPFTLTNTQAYGCPADQNPPCTDVHEVPALALDKDGYVNLIWANGIGGDGSSNVKFARSANPGDIGNMTSQDAGTVGLANELIYPWFFRMNCTDAITSASWCGLYIAYKTPAHPANSQLWIKRWNPTTRTWVSPVTGPAGQMPVVDGTCVPPPDPQSPGSPGPPCAYGQYYHVDVAPRDGVIRLVYTWDKATTVDGSSPGSDATTDLSYLESRDGGVTWQTASGTRVATPVTPATRDTADLLPGQHVTCINPVTSDSAGVTHLSFLLPTNGAYDPTAQTPTTWNYFHGWIDSGGFHYAPVTSLTAKFGPPCTGSPISIADVVTSGQTVMGIMRPNSDGPWYVWRSSPPYSQYRTYQLGTAFRGLESPIVDHTGWEERGKLMMLNDYLTPGTSSPNPSATISTTDASAILNAP